MTKDTATSSATDSTTSASADETPVDEGFRGPQVCSVVGITYRQLDYWARTGLKTPSISAAKGSGTQRRYSYRDVLELKVIKQLLDAGLSLASARRAVECLRDDLGEDIASANLVINGSGSVLARSGEELIDVLKGGQGVLSLVPMSGVVSELDAAIMQLRQPASNDTTVAVDSAPATAI
jgi:DNA-binding transcriptional MerR regulator